MGFDFSGIEQELTEALQAHDNFYSWTNVREAYLGNGETPPTVMVPATSRFAPGAVYIFGDNIDTKTEGQAISGVYFDIDPNTAARFAGAPVDVGYPPNSNMLHIRANARTLAHLGGVTPTQVTRFESQSITFDRFQELRLVTGSGMTPDLTGGKWYSPTAETDVLWGGGATIDLTSHRPATAGQVRWVLLLQDASKEFSVVLGDPFSVASGVPNINRLPVVSDPTLKRIAWVRLQNGQTQLTDSDILNRAHAPEAAGGTAGDITILDRILTDDDGNVLSDDDGNVLYEDA